MGPNVNFHVTTGDKAREIIVVVVVVVVLFVCF